MAPPNLGRLRQLFLHSAPHHIMRQPALRRSHDFERVGSGAGRRLGCAD